MQNLDSRLKLSLFSESSMQCLRNNNGSNDTDSNELLDQIIASCSRPVIIYSQVCQEITAKLM